MTLKEKREIAARRQALIEHLRNREGPVDPASLARAYGVPQPEVERMTRGMQRA